MQTLLTNVLNKNVLISDISINFKRYFHETNEHDPVEEIFILKYCL